MTCRKKEWLIGSSGLYEKMLENKMNGANAEQIRSGAEANIWRQIVIGNHALKMKMQQQG